MELLYYVNNNKYSTIKEVLKDYFLISDRLITKLKKNNNIFLNDFPKYIDYKINIGDKISVNLNFNEISENIIPKKMNLNIIYEDESLLIINKPANIPVHPSISHFEDSLSNGVQFYFQENNIKTKIRPVNRLDKDTSGIVIFAKNEYIQESLIKQMKNKTFEKNYYAILTGHINKKILKIDAPISRKDGSIIEREINKNGDNSVTYLELIKNFEVFFNKETIKLSLVKFSLETGRTHQLRVHSKYINHPILGDTLYGATSNLISRQALHAFKVKFIHPITKRNIILETSFPNDMQIILNNDLSNL